MTLCEVGPAEIRILAGAGAPRRADAELSDAALRGLDEPAVLVGDRVVDTAGLWSQLLGPLLADTPDTTLVHPSWWPLGRADRLAALAELDAETVTVAPRADLLARTAPTATLIEIAEQLVLVRGTDGAVGQRVFARADDVGPLVARLLRTVRRGRTDRVLIDAPSGVAGAADLAAELSRRLRDRGVRVRQVDDALLIAAVAAAGPQPDAAPPSPRAQRRRKWPAVAVVVAAITAALCSTGGETGVPATTLVEGRVGVQVPADWLVRRVTGGPGSARVEVSAPGDPSTILHITQARVPSTDLAATAAVLRRAVDQQPAGVFVDFDPDDRRAGRPAISYREVRPQHDIRWAVLLDGGTRIAIGCQAGHDRPHAIDAVCDRALETAREIS